MQFILETLIDITETNIYREDQFSKAQQANYNTVIQTIGLRANPLVQKQDCTERKVDGEFGSVYKGKHKVWTLIFEIEQSGYVTLETLENDLNLIPITTGLKETIEINNCILDTGTKKYKNIIFRQLT